MRKADAPAVADLPQGMEILARTSGSLVQKVYVNTWSEVLGAGDERQLRWLRVVDGVIEVSKWEPFPEVEQKVIYEKS